jgi:hypothetical protein
VQLETVALVAERTRSAASLASRDVALGGR